MLALKVAAETQGETCHAETIEEFLARGGRIERIEDHPGPEGRVLRRDARNSHWSFSALKAFQRRQE
jgi:hypothetical protein